MAVISTLPQALAAAGDEWVTEEITASKTWTVPDGVIEIEIMAFGGGGGGGVHNGGGSGYMQKVNVPTKPGEHIAIVIGAGGAGGADGGQTKFGDSVIADGGKSNGNGFAGGGMGGNTYNVYSGRCIPGGVPAGGGAGGMVSPSCGADGESTLTAKGGTGSAKSVSQAYNCAGGGGAGINGGDGGNGLTNNNDMTSGGGAGGYGAVKLATAPGGNAGLGYGAGGGGGIGSSSKYSGGNGAPGICIIKYRKVV